MAHALSVRNLKPSCLKMASNILHLHHITLLPMVWQNALFKLLNEVKKKKEGSMKMRLAKVVMAYRASPQSRTCESPVLLQKRQIHTRLDQLKPGQNESVEHCQQKQKAEHDALARQTTFSQGEVVYARNFGTESRWLPGVIQEISGPVSYLVKLTDGHLVRRHLDHVVQVDFS